MNDTIANAKVISKLKQSIIKKPSAINFWEELLQIYVVQKDVTDIYFLLNLANDKKISSTKISKISDAYSMLRNKKGERQIKEIVDFAKCKNQVGEYHEAVTLLQDQNIDQKYFADIQSTLAYSYIMLGHLNKAKEHHQVSLNLNPDDPNNHLNEIRLMLKMGKIRDALRSAQKYVNSYPDHAVGVGLLSICLKASKDDAASKIYADKALEMDPFYAEVYANRALLMVSENLKHDALSDLQITHWLRPNLKKIWPLLRDLSLEVADFQNAVSITENLIEAGINLGENYFKLAICHHKTGNLRQAIENYEKVLAINPSDTSALTNLGATYYAQGEFAASINTYKKAIKINPHQFNALNNLGAVYFDLGEVDYAIECYKSVLKQNRESFEAHCNLCEALEKTNRIDDLHDAILEAQQIYQRLPDAIKMYQMICAFRQKDIEEAKLIGDDINYSDFSIERKSNFYHIRGKIAEKLGMYEEAHEFFSSMNVTSKLHPTYMNLDLDVYLNPFKKNLKELSKIDHFINSTHYREHPTLAFIVGFPRSGTTLLDTLLRQHPKIDIIEEKNMLDLAKKTFNSKQVPDCITAFPSKDEIEQARHTYASELEKHRENKNATIVIDKLPLHILDMPLIYQLFPNAKFIFAVRHPLDTILSNWKQYFNPNPAMANMLDLRSAADFYCLAMSLFVQSRENLPIKTHQI